MRTTYRILAMLIAVSVVVQTALIAYALFDIMHKTDSGTTGPDLGSERILKLVA